MYKEEVVEEMRRILKVDKLDSSAPEYFQKQTSASKMVYNQMNEEKKQEVARLVDEYKAKGNSKEIKEK